MHAENFMPNDTSRNGSEAKLGDYHFFGRAGQFFCPVKPHRLNAARLIQHYDLGGTKLDRRNSSHSGNWVAMVL